MVSFLRGYFRTVPPRLVLVDRQEPEAPLDGLQGGGDSGRAGADDEEVEDVGPGPPPRGRPPGDGLHRPGPLVDRVPDEGDPSQLAGDEEARHGGLELIREHRDVRPRGDIAEADRDRPDGAGFGAPPVADAAGPVDHPGDPVDDAEDTIFRAGGDAAAAAEAEEGLDRGVLGEGPPAPALLGVADLGDRSGPLGRGDPALPDADNAQEHREERSDPDPDRIQTTST